jgi:hypothetical protein
VCSQYEVPPSGHNSTWEAQATGVAEEHGGRPCAQRERFSPPDQGPYCAHILQLWPVMACYGLGMRQPAHGCNVRAKRLTHWLLANSRRLLTPAVMLFSLPTGLAGDHRQRLTCGKRVPFALLTRADQGGTHPGLAGACQSCRRQKISTTKGGWRPRWIRRDLLPSCFLASLGFTFARCSYANERTAHEAPRLHRRKLRWHRSSICKRHGLISKGEIHILRDEASL